MTSSLIGSNVIFSYTPSQEIEGEVIDKVDALAKPESTSVVTKYLIRQALTNQLHTIEPWRLKKLLN